MRDPKKEVLIQQYSSLNPACTGEKSSETKCRTAAYWRNPLIYESAITYKQALRGLFVTGTSSVRHSFSDGGQNSSPINKNRLQGYGGQGKRSDDEPGLKTQIPRVLSCITLREKP